MSTYYLTSDLRKKLKKPVGLLIRGSFKETMRKLRRIVEEEKPVKIIAVGDRVSLNLVKNGLFPHLLIVDNKIMRRSVSPILISVNRTFRVKNPPGTITTEALSTIEEVLKQDYRTKIVVEGEEDLLTLAAVLYAPEKSFVVYGQPREGIVVVKVTKEKKAEVANFLKSMRKTSKS
ncbi:hypothetical protein DRO59_02770 [Candidatus Bathyarchaeota archaeon]|nr:MAG: hypothetical protein DRO59_02770 [Candidatus Bathyarchaeota archaeon]